MPNPNAQPTIDRGRAALDVEKLKARADEFEALYELAGELLQLDDYDTMLDVVVRHSLTLLRADRGFLVLLRGEARELDFKVLRNWSREELEGVPGVPARTGREIHAALHKAGPA